MPIGHPTRRLCDGSIADHLDYCRALDGCIDHESQWAHARVLSDHSHNWCCGKEGSQQHHFKRTHLTPPFFSPCTHTPPAFPSDRLSGPASQFPGLRLFPCHNNFIDICRASVATHSSQGFILHYSIAARDARALDGSCPMEG